MFLTEGPSEISFGAVAAANVEFPKGGSAGQVEGLVKSRSWDSPADVPDPVDPDYVVSASVPWTLPSTGAGARMT